MRKTVLSWMVAAAVFALAAPAWAQSAPKISKVTVQGTPSADGDTGAGTQPVVLFGIALPASGGVVFGGTSTNPLNVVFPSAQSVTGSGNFTVVQPTGSNLHIVCDSGCSSASGFADNAAFTFGTTSINPIGGVLDDTGTNAATENSAAIARITAQKALHMNLRNNSGTEVGTSGAPLRIDPTGSTTQPVSLASVPSHAVTNAGTFATQIDGAALTALQLIDNIVNTLGSTTSGSSGVLGLCGVTTSAPTYTTGQSHPCSLQTDGSLRVYLTGAANGSVSNDDDGTIADGGTNHTTVLSLTYAWNSDSGVADWTRLMHQPLDFDSGAGTENLSVIGIGLPASGGPVIGGTSSNPFNVVFPSAQAITVASLPLPSGAATEATLANTLTSANFAAAFGTAGSADSQVMSIQGIASMTPVQVQGEVAHDAADSGNPQKIGAKASNAISGLTPVAANDRVNLFAGLDGILLTRPHSNLEDRVSAVVGVTDGASTQLVAAQGAGLRFCATTLIVANSSATNVTVDIRDGTAGSVLATFPAAANMGGAVAPLQTPLCTSANTIFAMDPSAAASTVTVTAIGFKTAL